MQTLVSPVRILYKTELPLLADKSQQNVDILRQVTSIEETTK